MPLERLIKNVHALASPCRYDAGKFRFCLPEIKRQSFFLLLVFAIVRPGRTRRNNMHTAHSEPQNSTAGIEGLGLIETSLSNGSPTRKRLTWFQPLAVTARRKSKPQTG
jgi:hypothetical protein